MAFRAHQKGALLARIIQSIRDDGWSIIYLHDTRLHPFIFRVYKGDESYDIRLYIWNLTHGGGAQRPVDEYRIQITGVDEFELQPNGKTLILGWWNDGSVFAGFDYNKHIGAHGFSPSIQIREEALRTAYLNGFAPWTKENQEIAIAFRSDFFMEYVRNLESLHSFGDSAADMQVLEQAAQQPDDVNDEVINTVTAPRKTTVVSVTKKVRDNSFKSRVLTAYGNSCTLCGIQLKLIDAAHIVPVQHDGTDVTANGVALCALHHRAYDRNMVTFNDQYQILVNDSMIDKLAEIGLDGGRVAFEDGLRDILHLPPANGDRPHVDFINSANELRGWNLGM